MKVLIYLLFFILIFLFISPLIHEYFHLAFLNFFHKKYFAVYFLSPISGLSAEIKIYSPVTIFESSILLISGVFSSFLFSTIFYFLSKKSKTYKSKFFFSLISLAFFLDLFMNTFKGDIPLLFEMFNLSFILPIFYISFLIISFKIFLNYFSFLVKNLRDLYHSEHPQRKI